MKKYISVFSTKLLKHVIIIATYVLWHPILAITYYDFKTENLSGVEKVT